jgi:hypothetical protein
MKIDGKPIDSSLNEKDKLLGSAYTETVLGVDKFVTRNFTLSSIKTFVQGAVATDAVDLKANGGIVRESNELAIDLGASSITGQLANADLANSSITINSTAVSLGGSITLNTDNIAEGSSNQYFTNARSRSSISVTGGGASYNSSTGVITLPSQFTLATGNVTNASVSGQTLTLTRQSTSDITFTPTANDFTDADHSKLDGIEASADVTDTTNVVAALTAGTNITIAGDGTISSTDTNTQLTTEQVQDIVGAMFTGNTETRIAATYEDGDGTIDLVVDDMTANTQNTTTLSFVDSTNDVILRNTTGGATSGTQDIKFVAGSNVTLTPSGTNMTIASQAFGSVHTVSSESAMISATTTAGDIVIRTDVSKTFIHNGGSAGTAADFSELQFSGINNLALTAGDGITLSRTTVTNTDNDLTITNALATDTVTGGIQLFSNTDQSVAANSVTTTASRTYGLQLNSADQGVVNVPWTDTVYTHPTHDGDDIDIDTGALSGAVVISDLDLNVTTDTLGHVTDANASVATRTLTLANLGYTGATDANNYSLPTAAAGTLGGVKVGTNLSINGSGVLSADSQTDNNFTTTLKNKLDGISDSADVTDATTVTAAGALMDSEVTNLADVKAFDTTDYATAAQGAKADSAQQPPSEGAFANGDKTKLDGIAAGAQVNVATNLGQSTATDELTITSSTGNNITVAEATSSIAGLMSTTHHDKLDGIESGATADQSNAEIVAAIVASGSISDSDKGTFRSNIGAGTSNVAVGTGAGDALAGNTTTISSAQSTKLGHISVTQAVDLDTMESNITTNNSKVSNVTTNLGVTANGTSLTVTSSDGTNASIPAATTSDWGAMTDEDKTKLDGIETGATADQTNAEIKAAVEAATDSNVFTDDDHNKLDGIEAGADVTDAANVTLAGALMDSELTDLAGVKGVTISTLQPKPSEGAFVDGDKTKLDGIEASATADQTAAEIRTLVESASDSNVFTNADHTKLNGIETSATADQSDSEIKTAYENNSDTNAFTDALLSKLNGIETSATADQTITAGNGLSGGGTGNVTLTNSLFSDGKFFTVTANAGGGSLSLAQGLAASWNDSNGSGEVDFFFRDGGTNHATNTLYFHSYNGTDTKQVLKLGGASTAATTYVSVSGTLDVAGATTLGTSGTANLYLGNVISASSSDKGARFHSNNNDFFFDFQGDATQHWFLRDYDGSGGIHTRFSFDFINSKFTAAGDVVAFGSPSDISLKENIKPIESALDKVKKLQGVTFDWKEQDITNLKEDIGFIAQDVQKVLPELVRENKDGKLSLRHQGIIPVLLEAIKELSDKVKELENGSTK